MVDVYQDTIKEKWGKHMTYGMVLNDMESYTKSKPQHRESLPLRIETSWLLRMIAFIARSPSNDSRPVSITDYGPEVNQILTVLSLALNDHPLLRSPRLWMYLQQGLAQLPVPFPRLVKREAISGTEDPISSNQLLVMIEMCVAHVHTAQARLQSLNSWLLEISTFYIKTWLPILRPGVSRQWVYERYHRVFVGLIGHNLEDIYLISHDPTEPCFQLHPDRMARLDVLIQRIRENGMDPIDPHHHAWYALARARSRFLPCCWRSILDRSTCHLIIDIALQYIQQAGCDSSVAWALWGKSVADEDHPLELDPSDFRFLVNDISEGGHRHDDLCRTERMLVLLDSDIFIGQEFEPENMMFVSLYLCFPIVKPGTNYIPHRSVFEVYLRSLVVKKSALIVCRHFRRIACMNQANPHSKLFYLGSLASLDRDVIGSSVSNSPRTTTLQDTVRAGCYEVVQYLIQIGFNVTARDVNNHLAMSCRDTREGREFLNLLISIHLTAIFSSNSP